MATPHVVGIRAFRQPLECVLADRQEHPVPPLLRAPDEAALDEVGQCRCVCSAHGRDGLAGEAACERTEVGQQAACGRLEQLVAPADRRAQGSLPFRKVASALGRELEPVVERLDQLGRRQVGRAGGDELDRERQPVEATADLGDERPRWQRAAGGARTSEEELLRVGRRQGRQAGARAPRTRGGARGSSRGHADAVPPAAARRPAGPRRGAARSCPGAAGARGRAARPRASSSASSSACAIAGRTSAGSTRAASPTNQTPSANASASSYADRSATRVLPAPPVPVRVTIRPSPRRRAVTASTSARRPTNDVAGAGRWRRSRSDSGSTSSAMSWRSTAPWSARSSAPGSRPSSSSAFRISA